MRELLASTCARRATRLETAEDAIADGYAVLKAPPTHLCDIGVRTWMESSASRAEGNRPSAASGDLRDPDDEGFEHGKRLGKTST